MTGFSGAPVPNWKDQADYAFPESFPDAGWAWEFLRRNDEYRADYLAYVKKRDELIGQSGLPEDDLVKLDEWWHFDPEKKAGETVGEWRKRSIEKGIDP